MAPRSGDAPFLDESAVGSGPRSHIRLATWDDDPPVGGQGVYVRQLRTALEERGVRISTVAGRGSSAVPYRRLTGHGPLDLSIALNVSPAPLLAGNPDLIHVSGGPGGLQILRRPGLPVVYTAFHTFEMSHRRYKPQRWYGIIEAMSYRPAVKVIAISTSTADSLTRTGLPPERVVVIPPGVDVDRFRRSADRGRLLVLYVGRLEPEKGPLDALAVMAQVVADVPGASGLLVGRGSLSDEVRRRTAGLPRISYRAEVTDDEVADLYAAADVVLVPSRFEGFGLVAVEAMASGCAVIGYDVPGLRDAIAGRGLLVRPGDVRAMALLCRQLLEDPARRDDLGDLASASVRAEHTWSHRSAEILDVYSEVLAGVQHR